MSKPRVIWQDKSCLRIVRTAPSQYVVELCRVDSIGAEAWVKSDIAVHDATNPPPTWVVLSILEKLSRRRRRRSRKAKAGK